MIWLLIITLWVLICVLSSIERIAHRNWVAGVEYGLKHYDVLKKGKK